MGLNCKDIRRIIHWGPPSDIESYLQETGRDGLSSTAALYIGSHDLRSPHIEQSMKKYCKNTSICRRKLLLEDFDKSKECEELEVRLGCCDVCNMKSALEY